LDLHLGLLDQSFILIQEGFDGSRITLLYHPLRAALEFDSEVQKLE
jgi:hypothetical protein